jgi:hypothetical protein
MNDELERYERMWSWPTLREGGVKIGIYRQCILQLLFFLSTDVYCTVRRQLNTNAFLGLLFNHEDGDDISF